MTRLPLFVFLALFPLAGCSPEPEQTPDVIALADSLEKKVEELRGLRFRKPVKKGVKTAEQFLSFLREKIYETTPAQKMALYSKIHAMLGLVPEGFDIEKEMLSFLSVGVGGVYDPKTKEFFLALGVPQAMQKTIIVHEMTHALDDQYISLDKFYTAELTEDEGLGRAAVAEGSATLVMNLYQLRTPDALRDVASSQKEIMEFMRKQSEVLRRVPPYLARSLMCGYLAGPEFLAKLDVPDAKRAERVLEAFQNPPRSSEQVLHPEKYWDPEQRDEPMQLSMPDLLAVLGDGWKLAAQDTLGELNVATLTGEYSSSDFADPMAVMQIEWTNEAAQGWGGDRWVAYSQGEQLLVFWAIAWDSEEDAKEFLREYNPPSNKALVLCQGNLVLVAIAREPFEGLSGLAKRAMAGISVSKL